MRSIWALVVLIAGALLLSACDLLSDTGDAEVGSQPTPTAERSFLTPVVPNVPNITLPVTPTQETETLRIWIPPSIAATMLVDQISAYDADRPEITIAVEQKRVVGSGGILSYLRTGRDVAPSILPDLIAIPADVLPAMAGENLIYPLDDRIDDASVNALFPPALALGQTDTGLLGYVFALNGLPHLAYNNNALTGTLPLTWERLIENEEHVYVFAADGLDGALLALQFYLDAGGQLIDAAGQPVLEVDPLVAALRYIEDGQEQGLFAVESGTMNSTDEAWQSFLSGGSNIVQTTADNFLGQTIAGLPIAYTVIPGIDRPLTPLVFGRAWAISTSDPLKQEQAIELIQELTTPENLATWSFESDILPARRDAFDVWPVADPYTGFARQELERAEPLAISTSGKLFTVLSDAVFQIVTDGRSAEQAAVDAVNAMNN